MKERMQEQLRVIGAVKTNCESMTDYKCLVTMLPAILLQKIAHSQHRTYLWETGFQNAYVSNPPGASCHGQKIFQNKHLVSHEDTFTTKQLLHGVVYILFNYLMPWRSNFSYWDIEPIFLHTLLPVWFVNVANFALIHRLICQQNNTSDTMVIPPSEMEDWDHWIFFITCTTRRRKNWTHTDLEPPTHFQMG